MKTTTSNPDEMVERRFEPERAPKKRPLTAARIRKLREIVADDWRGRSRARARRSTDKLIVFICRLCNEPKTTDELYTLRFFEAHGCDECRTGDRWAEEAADFKAFMRQWRAEQIPLFGARSKSTLTLIDGSGPEEVSVGDRRPESKREKARKTA